MESLTSSIIERSGREEPPVPAEPTVLRIIVAWDRGLLLGIYLLAVESGLLLIVLAVTIFRFFEVAFPFGDELLVGWDLFGSQDRLHAFHLLVLHAGHGGTVLLSNGACLGFRLIENDLQLGNLLWRKLQLALHLGNIALPKVFSTPCEHNGRGVISV